MSDKLPWFRMYSEMVGDIKFDIISRETGLSKIEVIGAWTLLLCAANNSPVRGALYVTSQRRHSDGDVAAMLSLENAIAQSLVKSMMELDMLEDVDGAIHVKNWDKRQFSSDNSAERTKKYRSKQNSTVTVTSHSRHSDDGVTPPDTDTDTELNTAPAEAGAAHPSERAKAEAIFSQVTGIDAPERPTPNSARAKELGQSWYQPLARMLRLSGGDIDLYEKLLRKSFKDAQQNKVRIYCPRSIEKTFGRVKAISAGSYSGETFATEYR